MARRPLRKADNGAQRSDRWPGRAVAAAVLIAAAMPLLVGCRGVTRARAGQQQPGSIMQIFAPPSPAEAAAWAADPYDADKRYRGMLLLANAPFGGERIYVEMFARASTDEDSSVRSAAIRGLALHGSPEHVPLILAQASDPDRLLRWECARALQRLNNPAAVPALLKLLDERSEPEPLIRAAAADALGQYAEPRVLDALIAALRDRDLSVNLAALESLRTLTGQDLGQNFRAWVAWRKDEAAPFAGRRPYIYPVFQRDRTFVEWVLPFFRPPNEIASTPVGFGVAGGASGVEAPISREADPGSVRNN